MTIEHTEHLVKPTLPTVLQFQPYYELLPTDQLIGQSVDTVHVIPGDTDASHFKEALSRTLAIYPLAAGRYERPASTDGPWKIRLTNSGVPVTFLESDAEQIMPNAHVMQNQTVASLIRIVNIKKIRERNSDEPLARFTLIRFPRIGSTVIGFSQYHPLGDGYTVLNFLRLLSQTYQGLPPLDEPPCYARPPFNPVKPSTLAKYPLKSLELFNLEFSYPVGGIAPLMGKSKGNVSRIDIHFSANFTRELRAAVHARIEANRDLGGKENLRLSRQDTLMALLARAFIKSDPEHPIRHILSLFNFRGISSFPSAAVGNALIGCATDEIQHDAWNGNAFAPIDLIAQRVREALIRIRNPDFFDALVDKAARIMKETTDEDLTQDYTPQSFLMNVNSTWRFDWNSAHFGYPGEVQFYHTILQEPRFCKIVQPNPSRLSDGTWKTYSGDAEVTLFVLKNTKGRFEEALIEELQALGIEEKPGIDHSDVI